MSPGKFIITHRSYFHHVVLGKKGGEKGKKGTDLIFVSILKIKNKTVPFFTFFPRVSGRKWGQRTFSELSLTRKLVEEIRDGFTFLFNLTEDKDN
jgi:hypothetical protein